MVLAFGFVLAALVAAIGHLSGAHLNPAITVSLASTRRFPWRMVPVYLIAQLVGALLAALGVWATFGEPARARAHLGLTVPATGVGGGRVVFVEAVATFVLVLVVAAVGSDDRVPSAAAPLAAGFALAAAIFVAAPVTGGGVNPARVVGPMLIAGSFDEWWAYVVGPLIGGIAAANLYWRAIADTRPPETS